MNLSLHSLMGTAATTNNTVEHSYLSGNLSPLAKKPVQTSNSLCLSPMSSRRKMKKKRRRVEAMMAHHQAPALYTEDIGSEGIKKKTQQILGVSNTISHSASSSFNVPETNDEKRRRRQRMERFGKVDKTVVDKDDDNGDCGEPEGMTCALSSTRSSSSSAMVMVRNNNNEAYQQRRVVGTSTALEKPYLRLTTHAKPEDVRPLPVLIRCLAHIKSEFIKNEDFDWTNEQMRSLRQDLTVQGIRNKFVLEVYETHARILLENGDLDEFHQCQTMIRNLTSSSSSSGFDDDNGGVKGDGNEQHEEGGGDGDDEKNDALKQTEECADEFQAYGILFNVVQNNWGELTHSLTETNEFSTDASSDVSSSSDTERHGTSRRHALKVVKSVVHDDYQTFFRLYEAAPHMSAYLMDFLVRRVRDGAYERIVTAYRPTLSVEHFREALHLDDLEETRRFLKKSGAVFVQEQGGPAFWVDCKSSTAALSSEKP